MKIKRSASSWVAALSVALAALGSVGVAQAGDNVFWSVGMSSPGIQVGVANAVPVVQQMYVPRQPVYMAPQPVYVQPAPVYMAQPQYVQVGWERPNYGWERRHGHRHHGHGHDRHRDRDRDHDRD
jgi:hypothetical protein